MNFENIDGAAVINNEFDYSNVIVGVEYVEYLVNYLDSVYKKILELIAEDEEKNKQFKEEYKDYMFKKCYSDGFEVYIRQASYSNNTTCKDAQSFKMAIEAGQLKNVEGLDVKLTLDFQRGKGKNLDKHENSFVIKFKPYDIKFVRKSNHSDPNMQQIENNINEILKKFPVANSIFCTK